MPGNLRIGDLETDLAAVFAVFDTYLDGPADHPVGVAVSGGGDSVALLYALHQWGRRPLHVFCVDHGLNPASVEWTDSVRVHAETLGLDFTALHWQGSKPRAGISAKARQARHGLLADAARLAGIRVLCLGHTRDDIAEAERMAEQGSSVGAPQLWSPSPAWPQGRGVFLLRPLLDARRADLRNFLRARHVTWIEDPANDSPTSLRAIARRAIDNGDLPALAVEMPVRRDPARLLCGPDFSALGMITLDAGVLSVLPTPEAQRHLATAAVCAGGGDRLPGSQAVARLYEALPGGSAHTLCGARVVQKAGRIVVVREAGEFERRTSPGLALTPDNAAMWDGRFAIRASQAASVQPSGRVRAALGRGDRARLQALPAALRATLPAVVADGGAIVLPITPLSEDKINPGTEFACWVLPRFLAASGAFFRESDLCGAAAKPL